jgi:sensor c-di-GMP phosphodiesterase-like protein
VAIDDFGTGYSSLAYLATLPVDVLKVDKAFVDKVGGENEGDGSLVKAILAMADSLNLSTVAEGVEHAAQAEWLREAQCALGQGYLWSRPVPFDDAVELLDGSPARGKHAGSCEPELAEAG